MDRRDFLKISLLTLLFPKEAMAEKEIQLRGAGVGLNKTLNDLLALQSLGANCIRWQFVAVNDEWTWVTYEGWLHQQIDELILTLSKGHLSGMKIIIALVTPPMGSQFYDRRKLTSSGLKRNSDWFVETWKIIASRTNAIANVWGYDLINEPSLEPVYLNKIQDRAATAIRRITRSKKIIATCKVGAPKHLTKMKPIEGIDYYTFHMYSPPSYTHQGVNGNPSNVRFRRGATKRTLDAISEWQRKYKKQIYVGEFSAARWAPDREKWFEEVIKYFNKRRWHWTYHAWRESHIFDQELPATPRTLLVAEDRQSTPSLDVLIKGFNGAI